MASAALGFSSLTSFFGVSRPAQRLPVVKPTTFIAGLLASSGASFNLPSLLGEIWDGLLKAVPKKKTSHMKQRSRLNAGKALKDVSGYVKCASCGNPKKQHHLCPFCTSYLYQFMPKKDESLFMHKYDLAWKNKTMPFFEDPEAVKKAERDELSFLYKEQKDFKKLKQLREVRREEAHQKQIAAIDGDLDAWIKKRTAKMSTLPSSEMIENIKGEMLVLQGVIPTGPNKAPLPDSPPMPGNWAAELEAKLAEIRSTAQRSSTDLNYELKKGEYEFFADKKRNLLGTKRLDQVIKDSRSGMEELQPSQLLQSSLLSEPLQSSLVSKPLQSSILHSAIFGGLFSGSSEPENKEPARHPKVPKNTKLPKPATVLHGKDLASKLESLDRQLAKAIERATNNTPVRLAAGKSANLEYAIALAKYRDLNVRQRYSPVFGDRIKRQFAELNRIRDKKAAECKAQEASDAASANSENSGRQ